MVPWISSKIVIAVHLSVGSNLQVTTN
jgi:hypothetical protein